MFLIRKLKVTDTSAPEPHPTGSDSAVGLWGVEHKITPDYVTLFVCIMVHAYRLAAPLIGICGRSVLACGLTK